MVSLPEDICMSIQNEFMQFLSHDPKRVALMKEIRWSNETVDRLPNELTTIYGDFNHLANLDELPTMSKATNLANLDDLPSTLQTIDISQYSTTTSYFNWHF